MELDEYLKKGATLEEIGLIALLESHGGSATLEEILQSSKESKEEINYILLGLRHKGFITYEDRLAKLKSA